MLSNDKLILLSISEYLNKSYINKFIESNIFLLYVFI